ncbi:MAG: gamma-glutamyltransferase, partial [Psychrobacter celer]
MPNLSGHSQPPIITTLKSAMLIASSTLLLSVSAHALEPVTPTDANVINNTSINTSAINLAIMTDNPTVLSETKRITPAQTNTLTSTTNKIKTEQAIYSEDAIHHPVWAKNGMVASQEALASDIG